jgi:branched-chain amino acid transport system permease protein
MRRWGEVFVSTGTLANCTLMSWRRACSPMDWGQLLGGGIASWFAYVMALGSSVFRPQGLFGEKLIERI